MCDIITNAGFFAGLWDGIFALISLIADIFFDINVYDECSGNTSYLAGFIVGLLAFGWSFKLLGGLWWIVFLASAIIWLISFMYDHHIILGIVIGILFTVAFLKRKS